MIDFSKRDSIKFGISGTVLHQTVGIDIDFGKHQYNFNYGISVNTLLGASLDMTYLKGGVTGKNELVAGLGEHCGVGFLYDDWPNSQGVTLHVGATVPYTPIPGDYSTAVGGKNFGW